MPAPVSRERILDGAAQALARHGLAKLDMADVSATCGVSRGTLYRYFPSRDALLAALAEREGLVLRQQMLEAVAAVPQGPEQVVQALLHATRHIRQHAALQRLLETDPAQLLGGLQREFPALKAELLAVLRPMLATLPLVRRKVATASQLTDWMLRLMISALLFPEPDVDDMVRGIAGVYRVLTTPEPPAARSTARRRSATRRRSS